MSAVLPDVAALELTYRCNHKCRFCSCPWYAEMLKPGTEMDAAEWRQLICEFADQGVRQFAITGGEALLKEGVFDILDCAANVGSVNLLSNEPALKPLPAGRTGPQASRAAADGRGGGEGRGHRRGGSREGGPERTLRHGDAGMRD